ncbi:MAG: hypothetical protein NUW01_04445 [Gemmatimonadaceae bacterium]|nr:hypothetical protein [Gemmatimonadaceae bacterium]
MPARPDLAELERLYTAAQLGGAAERERLLIATARAFPFLLAEARKVETLTEEREKWGPLFLREIARVCGLDDRASMDAIYNEMVATRAQAETLREALAEDPEKWSYRTLLTVAELILDRDYGPEVFPDMPAGEEDSGDVGPWFVRSCRAAIRASRAALEGVPGD